MKFVETIIKLGVAIAAVAGIAFLVVKYMDAIKAWLEKLFPVYELEEDFVEEIEETEATNSPEEGAEPAATEAPGETEEI